MDEHYVVTAMLYGEAGSAIIKLLENTNGGSNYYNEYMSSGYSSCQRGDIKKRITKRYVGRTSQETVQWSTFGACIAVEVETTTYQKEFYDGREPYKVEKRLMVRGSGKEYDIDRDATLLACKAQKRTFSTQTVVVGVSDAEWYSSR